MNFLKFFQLGLLGLHVGKAITHTPDKPISSRHGRVTQPSSDALAFYTADGREFLFSLKNNSYPQTSSSSHRKPTPTKKGHSKAQHTSSDLTQKKIKHNTKQKGTEVVIADQAAILPKQNSRALALNEPVFQKDPFNATLALRLPNVAEYGVKRANGEPLAIPEQAFKYFEHMAFKSALHGLTKEFFVMAKIAIAHLNAHPYQENSEASKFERYNLLSLVERYMKYLQGELRKYIRDPRVNIVGGREEKLMLTEASMAPFFAKIAHERRAYEHTVHKCASIFVSHYFDSRHMDATMSRIGLAALEGYDVKVFYNDQAVLTTLLRNEIQKFSGLEEIDLPWRGYTDETVAIPQRRAAIVRALALQNTFTEKFKEWATKGIVDIDGPNVGEFRKLNFDEAAIKFMAEDLGLSDTASKNARSSVRGAYTQFKNKVNQLPVEIKSHIAFESIEPETFALPHDTSDTEAAERYLNYHIELALLNHKESASNLVKMPVLYKRGGLLLGEGVFPNFRAEIFPNTLTQRLTELAKQFTHSMEDVDAMVRRALYAVVLEHFEGHPFLPDKYSVPEWLSDPPNQPPRPFHAERAQLRQDLRGALRDYNFNVVSPRFQNLQNMSPLQIQLRIFSEYFERLGDIKVGPSGIAVALNNNDHVTRGRSERHAFNGDMIAAVEHSKVVQYEVEKSDDFYRLLRHTNYLQYPSLDQSNIEKFFSQAEVGKNRFVNRNEVRAHRGLPALAVDADPMLPLLPGYRLYGFRQHAPLFQNMDSLLKTTQIYSEKKLSAQPELQPEIYQRLARGAAESSFAVMTAQKSLEYVKSEVFVAGHALAQKSIGRLMYPLYFDIVDEANKINSMPSSRLVTRYARTVIVQVDNDLQSSRAARFLANKHPGQVGWVKVNLALQQGKLDFSVIKFLSSRSRSDLDATRVVIIGHGQHADGVGRIGTLDAAALEKLLQQLQNNFDLHAITRLSLVACDAARCAAPMHRGPNVDFPFMTALFNALRERAVTVGEVSAYERSVMIDNLGRKMPQYLRNANTWVRGGGSRKGVFTQAADGTVSVKWGEDLDRLEHRLQRPNMAGPLSEWGSAKYFIRSQQQAKEFRAGFDHAFSTLQETPDLRDWVPQLETLHQGANHVAKMRWEYRGIDSAFTGQHKEVSMHDTVFGDFLHYIKKHSIALDAFEKNLVTHKHTTGTDRLVTKPISLGYAQRMLDAYFAIKSIANVLTHRDSGDNTPLGHAVALHSQFDAGQAAYSLAEEGVQLAKVASRHLVKNKPVLSAIIRTAKVSQLMGHVVNPSLTFINLGFSINDFIQAKDTDRETIHAVSLGFDSAAAGVAVGGIVAGAMSSPLAFVAGPAAIFLMAIQARVMGVLAYEYQERAARAQQALMRGHFANMVNAYRHHGFTHDSENKTLVAIPSAIITSIDLRHQHVLVTLASPSLAHVDSYRRVQQRNTDNTGYLGAEQRHADIELRTDVTRDGLHLSKPLHLSVGNHTLAGLSKDVRTIVLSLTPRTRYDFTVGRVAHHNEHDQPHTIMRAALPNLYNQPSNLVGNERLTSLVPHYKSTTTSIYLNAAPTTLLVPSLPAELQGFTICEITGGGVMTLVPQLGVPFVIKAGPQPSVWNIDSRHLREDILEYFLPQRANANGEIEPTITPDAYPRIIYTLQQNANGVRDILFHTDRRGHTAQLGDNGKMQRTIHNANHDSEQSTIKQLLKLIEHDEASAYITVNNLSRNDAGGHVVSDVGVFDAQRRQIVYSKLNQEYAAFVGAGNHTATGDYYFTDKDSQKQLWCVHGGKRQIAMQFTLLFSDYGDLAARIVSIKHQDSTTVLEQHLPQHHVRQSDTTHLSPIRLLSTINGAQIELVSIILPPEIFTPTLHKLQRSMRTSHGDYRIPVSQESSLLEHLFALSARSRPHVSTYGHHPVDAPLHQAGYAPLIQISGQDPASSSPTHHAWLWRKQNANNQTEIHLIEPRYTINGTSQLLPDLASMQDIGGALVARTIDGRFYRVAEHDSIDVEVGGSLPKIRHHDELKLIGLDANWTKQHYQNLSSDIRHLVQETPAVTHLFVKGFYEWQIEVLSTQNDTANPTLATPSSMNDSGKKAIHALYDVDEEKMMFIPSGFNQTNIEYLGSDRDSGGWLYDRQKNHLYYAALIDPQKIHAFFTPDLQATINNWQISQRLFADYNLTDARRSENGNVVVTTAEGLILGGDMYEESEIGKGPLLLAVTSAWKNTHSDTLDVDLAILATRYETINRTVTVAD